MELLMKTAEFVKADDDRALVVRFTGKMGEPDRDGDIFHPGSYQSRDNVPLANFNHSLSAPVGIGKLSEVDGQMCWTGKCFDTPAGHEAFAIIKEMGGSQEYSYRFHPIKYSPRKGADVPAFAMDFHEVEVYEVSPVFKAASFDTGTVLARSADDEWVKAAQEPALDPPLEEQSLDGFPTVSPSLVAARERYAV